MVRLLPHRPFLGVSGACQLPDCPWERGAGPPEDRLVREQKRTHPLAAAADSRGDYDLCLFALPFQV